MARLQRSRQSEIRSLLGNTWMNPLALVNGRHLEVVIARNLEPLVECLMDVKSFVSRLYLGMVEADSLSSSLALVYLTPCALVYHLLNAKALIMWLALVLVAASPPKPTPDYPNSRMLASLAALFPALGVTSGHSQFYLQQVLLLRKTPLLVAECHGMTLLKTVPPLLRMIPDTGVSGRGFSNCNSGSASVSDFGSGAGTASDIFFAEHLSLGSIFARKRPLVGGEKLDLHSITVTL